MYVRPSAPLTVGGVLDDAIKLYRESFSRCWVIALVFAAISTAFSVALAQQLPRTLVPGRQGIEQILSLERSPRFIVGYFVVLLLTLICQGALLARQNAVARGDADFTVARALAAGVRKLPAMVAATILFVIIVCIGLIALIIPGIYLSGRLLLWMPAMFVDDAGPLKSIDASWRLTKRRWWRAAAIATVAVIIILVFSLVLSLIAGVIAGLFTAFGRASLSHGLSALQLISVATNVITLPMAPALWLAMYNDFKLRSEGGDLATRVGALSGA